MPLQYRTWPSDNLSKRLHDIEHGVGVLQLLSAISNSEFFNVTNQIGTALANLLPGRVGNDVLKYNYTQAFLPGLITAATGLLYEPCLVSAGLTGAIVGKESCLLVACAPVRLAHVSAQTEGLTAAATGLSFLLCLVSAGLTGDVEGKEACLLVACAPEPMHRCRSEPKGLVAAATGLPYQPRLASAGITGVVVGERSYLLPHAQMAPCVIKRAV